MNISLLSTNSFCAKCFGTSNSVPKTAMSRAVSSTLSWLTSVGRASLHARPTDLSHMYANTLAAPADLSKAIGEESVPCFGEISALSSKTGAGDPDRSLPALSSASYTFRTRTGGGAFCSTTLANFAAFAVSFAACASS